MWSRELHTRFFFYKDSVFSLRVKYPQDLNKHKGGIFLIYPYFSEKFSVKISHVYEKRIILRHMPID